MALSEEMLRLAGYWRSSTDRPSERAARQWPWRYPVGGRGKNARLDSIRRLRVRFERMASIHEVFMKIAYCLIWWLKRQPTL